MERRQVPSLKSIGGRGIPDVSGDAYPATGYIVRVDGKVRDAGISAVRRWGGIDRRGDQHTADPPVHPAGDLCRQGERRFPRHREGARQLTAGPDWDPCTGLGSPIASQLIRAVKPGSSIAAARNKAATLRQ